MGERREKTASNRAAINSAASLRPQVSIIVPVYNDERYVKRALTSCLRQTLRDIEVICVDDGSSDGSLALLNQAAAEDGRVRVVAQERNGGSHNARLAGVRRARGDLMMFLDADDELTRSACQDAVDEHAADPAAILHFAMRIRGGRGVTDEAVRDLAAWTRPVEGPISGRDVVVRSFVDHDYSFSVCGKAFEREPVQTAFEMLGEMRSDSGEDGLEYFAIAFNAGSYRGIPQKCAYVYHLADGLSEHENLTAQEFERVLRTAKPVEAMRAFLEERGALEEYCDVYEAHRADQLRVALKNWEERVVEADKPACLRRVLETWPREDVIDAVCALGSDAVKQLTAIIGDCEFTPHQMWLQGYADGAKATREEIQASGTYRIGKTVGALPRKLLALRGR